MTTPNTKLYATQGNGGKASVRVGDLAASLSPATTSAAGVVKQAAHMANVGAAPTQTDFNNLLAALQAAGLMA